MTTDRGVYGQIADLLDEAKDAMSIGAILAAIANTEDALRIMRDAHDVRSKGYLATRPTTPASEADE